MTWTIGMDEFLSLSKESLTEPKSHFSQDQNYLLIHLLSVQQVTWMEDNKRFSDTRLDGALSNLI